MKKYAAAASLLFLTMVAASLVALPLGAVDSLTGRAKLLSSLQNALHHTLVVPLGRELAVGLVLFAGMLPTLWTLRGALWARASKRRVQTESPTAALGMPGAEADVRMAEKVAALRARNAPGPLDETPGPMRPSWQDGIEGQAIILRRFLPPPVDPKLSFYGGLPIAPPDFVWPTAQSPNGPKPLHFLLQVDCGNIAEAARLGMLPSSGVLYFFLDFEWGDPTDFRVMYVPSPNSNWREVAMPEGLGPIFGGEAKHSWPWIVPADAKNADLPRLMPRWPFDPQLVTLPPEDAGIHDEDDTLRLRWWHDSPALTQALWQAQGERVVKIRVRPREAGQQLVRPYPEFPHDWRAVAITSAMVLDKLSWTFAHSAKRRGLSEDEVRAAEVELRKEAQECLAWANSHKPFVRVPVGEAAMFWDWLCGLDEVNDLVVGDAATRAINTTLAHAPETGERLSTEALALVHPQHALAVQSDSGFRARTPNRMLAPASDVQGYLEEVMPDEVLLLEISSDEAIGHRFGEGVYQFTIAPDDMRALRFDKVRLTISAY